MVLSAAIFGIKASTWQLSTKTLQEGSPVREEVSSGHAGQAIERHGTAFGVRRTHMDNQVPRYVTQKRAALLLGIPEEELSQISRESELGHTERAGDQKETFFTYEELRRICFLSTRQ
jgi:hypothetical protein